MIAAIEAPCTFLQEPVKILLFNAVELAHLPLCLVPEILDAVDMILALCKQCGMIDAAVMEGRDIQRIITAKIIRIDDAVRCDFLLNDLKNEAKIRYHQ